VMNLASLPNLCGSLEDLCLYGCGKVSSVGVKALSSFLKMERLDIRNITLLACAFKIVFLIFTRNSEKQSSGLEYVLNRCTNLQSIKFKSPRSGFRELWNFFKHTPRLDNLVVQEAVAMTNPILEEVAGFLPNLKNLR
jgi:hypothetical protein